MVNSNLHEVRKLVAALAEVACEALAEASIVVALSATTTLVGVEVRGLSFLGTRRLTTTRREVSAIEDNIRHVDGGDDVKTRDLGHAAVSTLVILNPQKMLVTLNGVACEGDVETSESFVSSSATVTRLSLGSLHISVGHDAARHVVDHLVRQHAEGKADIVTHISTIDSSQIIKDDRDGGERLIQLRAEGNSERLTGDRLQIEVRRVAAANDFFTGDELDALRLVFVRVHKVVASVKDIGAVWAHALGTVNIGVLRIAHAATYLMLVPATVRETLARVIPYIEVPIDIKDLATVRQVLDILARTMT